MFVPVIKSNYSFIFWFTLHRKLVILGIWRKSIKINKHNMIRVWDTRELFMLERKKGRRLNMRQREREEAGYRDASHLKMRNNLHLNGLHQMSVGRRGGLEADYFVRLV